MPFSVSSKEVPLSCGMTLKTNLSAYASWCRLLRVLYQRAAASSHHYHGPGLHQLLPAVGLRLVCPVQVCLPLDDSTMCLQKGANKLGFLCIDVRLSLQQWAAACCHHHCSPGLHQPCALVPLDRTGMPLAAMNDDPGVAIM